MGKVIDEQSLADALMWILHGPRDPDEMEATTGNGE